MPTPTDTDCTLAESAPMGPEPESQESINSRFLAAYADVCAVSELLDEFADFPDPIAFLQNESDDPPQRCPCCAEWYHPHNTTFRTVNDASELGRIRVEEHCEGCMDCGDYVTAQDTGGIYTDDAAHRHLHFHEGPDEWYTYPPDEPEEDSGTNYGNCMSYGTNVLNVHGWPRETPADALCFGVELEMEPRGATQREVVDELGGCRGNGRYILKEDGSLESGVELVTLPYMLDYHRKQFGWSAILNPDLHRIARSGSGTNRCGIHVHVNRAALSPLTIGKMIVFLNNADNASLVTTIAQRASNGYASRDTAKKITDIHCGNRYDLLNVSGSNTIEFRLFKGNLRPERVIKNLEFCHALIRFCEQNSVKASTRGPKFLQWLATRTQDYPALSQFLRDAGIMPSGTSLAELLQTLHAPALTDL